MWDSTQRIKALRVKLVQVTSWQSEKESNIQLLLLRFPDLSFPLLFWGVASSVPSLILWSMQELFQKVLMTQIFPLFYSIGFWYMELTYVKVVKKLVPEFGLPAMDPQWKVYGFGILHIRPRDGHEGKQSTNK